MAHREKTKYTGVYYRTSSTKRYDGKPDVCFDIAYKLEGKLIWEKVGWRSEGYTAVLASEIRGERIRKKRQPELFPEPRTQDLTYQQAWEIQQIDDELVKETIEEAKKKGKLPTLELAIRLFRKKRSAENKAKKMEEKRKSFAAIHGSGVIKLDEGKYNIIYANPVYESEENDKNLIVSIDDMKKIQIPADDNAILFLWSNSTDLIASLEVITAWGFTYREHAIWDFGKAKTAELCFETRHKVLLVATKGDNLPKPKLKKASVYQERREATEVKPTYYYETIERMFPEESYLDVFSAEPCNSKWKTLFNKDEEEKDNEEN